MVYTLETLLPGNETYNLHHRLLEKDLQKINDLAERIGALRTEQTTPAPLDGDILIYDDEDGKQLRASIEVRTYHGADKPHVEICKHAYIPFIGESLRTDTSGGPWHNLTMEEFFNRVEYIGREPERLKAWGHCGMEAEGAIVFEAQVNIWRINGTL